MQSPSVQAPKGAMASMGGGRARSANNESAMSREEADAPACFSGESNDSHVERVTSHVGPRSFLDC